ncbi:MAG: class I SAM-dependent methyltransferase [Bacteroidetes bacterium]|nr:MAG: class I SAM-dependent methyltransferase [Bacteroidota bacterium]
MKSLSDITYDQCPACGSAKIRKELTTRDFTVSNEEFEVWECTTCRLRFTQHVPGMMDIGKFYQSENYISHTETSKGFINRIYHIVRKRTLTGKRKLINSQIKKNSHANPYKILDIGAGTGAFVSHMKEHGWMATGLEPDPEARKKARELYDVELLPAEELQNQAANSFDVITLWHVLEHVHDLHNYLDRLKNITKPGGIILIAVPNYTSFDGGHYREFWAAYDVPRHLYHFSPQSMRQLLEKHSLQLDSIHPMWFDSFYISMLSEKYKTASTNLLSSSIIATISNLKTLFRTENCSSLVYVVKS